MPQKNGYRSSRGRSAIARKVLQGNVGKTNAMMPHILVNTQKGVISTSYFGGSLKGGAMPSATGFMRPQSMRSLMHSPATNNNYLFSMNTIYTRGINSIA